MSYIEENRGYITASKLKCFMVSPEDFFYKYILEVPSQRPQSKACKIGTAVDDWISYGEEVFNKKYFVKQKINKQPLIEMLLLNSDYTEVELKKYKVGDLELMYYGDTSKKIELTGLEYDQVSGCVAELQRQPLFNKDGKYTCQKTYTGKFLSLKLKGTLDRDSEDEIRDTKTTRGIKNFMWDWNNGLGYDVSMHFYQILKKTATGKTSKLIFDVVESNYPYASRIFETPTDTQIIDKITEALKLLNAMMIAWEETKDEKIWAKKHTQFDDLGGCEMYPIMSTALQQEIETLQ